MEKEPRRALEPQQKFFEVMVYGSILFAPPWKIEAKRKAQRPKRNFAVCRLLFAFGFLSFAAGAGSQPAVDVGGIITVNYLNGGNGKSPLVHNDGVPGFELVGDLFMNVRVSEEASVFLELETWRGWEVRLYSASLTYKISGERLQVEAGKFAAPFGNFLPRRFAPQNFLYGYPLHYEYRVGLGVDKVPRHHAELLNARGTAGEYSTQVIARQSYLSGAQLFGKLGRFGYSVGLANGALCNPTDLSVSQRPMVFGRLHLQPAISLKIGVSAASGNYLNHKLVKNQRPNLQPEKYAQYVAGLDIEYSRGYLVFFGEGTFSRWQSPFISGDLDALAFSVEARYKILPRLFVAARYGRLDFSDIADAQDVDADGKLAEPWEFPVWRLESGAGYYLSRHALLKAVWQINRTQELNPGSGDPADDLIAVQMTVFY
jgi:hypothetical protein